MSSVLKYFLVLLLVLSGINGYCQQVPQFVQYYSNPFLFNSSLAGYGEKTNAYFIRNQKFTGFDGGNISNILTVDGKIYEDKLGLGVALFNDQAGALTAQGAALSLSYNVKFSETARMGFGISGGITDRRFDLGNVIIEDADDPMLEMNFPARRSYADASAGIYLDVKEFQMGVSVPQLIGNSLQYEGGATTLRRHYILHARYKWHLNEVKEISLVPFARRMYVPGAPVQYALSVIADVMNMGWVGAGWRSDYAVFANLGLKIKKNLHVGYAYHFVMNTTKAYGPVNQEVLLGYTFGVRSDDKAKKELEDATRENERLQNENLKLEEEKDSVRKAGLRAEEELKRKQEEAEKALQDSITGKEERIRQLEKEKEELEKRLRENPGKNTSSEENKTTENNTTENRTTENKTTENKTTENRNTETYNDEEIKKSLHDHFLESDKVTEVPKGYYVVSGAFGKVENAEAFFNTKVKDKFPNARIIFNERNHLHYIILDYSTEKQPVFKTIREARKAGITKAWILDY